MWGAVVLLAAAAAGYEFDSGPPAGYLSECPGMNRSTRFSPATARSLTLLVYRQTGAPFPFDLAHHACPLGAKGLRCVAKRMDFERDTKVLISGYLDTRYSPLMRQLARQQLARRCNVLVLDIFPVLFRSYPIAARTTRPLGARLGTFLAGLSPRLLPSRLHILGGSLGAHIGYYAARQYRDLTGDTPDRLTGLDPAGPCFRPLPPAARFSRGAARRVDALHTNIDGFGIAEPTADVDYYASGGEYQPSMVGGFILPCFTLCSHVRAAQLWAAAHDHPAQFIAVRCLSLAHARRGDCYPAHTPVTTNLLGPDTDFDKPGIYYLPTNATPPYYAGQSGLVKHEYGLNQFLKDSTPDTDLVL
ncbi:hypothetical protein JYU34_009319 [Plutella xylostella]|uniref:Lipase domain-containing protein n=1 Tax=Plutella xylostella TaxID=51655 RepID=A0ABQ7QJ64_PLUXY|nr:hypothetical protein JYU34_009319 [Plutella xylostella]